VSISYIAKGIIQTLPRWRRDGKRDPDDRKFLADHSTMKTSSAIQSFLLAATLHPEIVRLGQRELDEVLGGERLPDFSDMTQLPYITAIVKEVLRWRPPTPLGGSSCDVTPRAYWADCV